MSPPPPKPDRPDWRLLPDGRVMAYSRHLAGWVQHQHSGLVKKERLIADKDQDFYRAHFLPTQYRTARGATYDAFWADVDGIKKLKFRTRVQRQRHEEYVEAMLYAEGQARILPQLDLPLMVPSAELVDDDEPTVEAEATDAVDLVAAAPAALAPPEPVDRPDFIRTCPDVFWSFGTTLRDVWEQDLQEDNR